MRSTIFKFVLLVGAVVFCGQTCRAQAQDSARSLHGVVLDEKSEAVPNVLITAQWKTGHANTITNSEGLFLLKVPAVALSLSISGKYIASNRIDVSADTADHDVQLRIRYEIPRVQQTMVITATAADPAIDRRNDAVYKNTLFLRDDQLFETLDGGINAGQHEGGGKSIEVRRYGFNLDHGGGNGGLKVLVDDVPQNQATQGHGQGYLGSLKSLSPELVEDVDIINGPFRAEYGDFSALGVIHIRLKEHLDNTWTFRAQGGAFNGYRTFAAWSPQSQKADSFLAWEHAYTDGPFLNPLRYLRDNITGNYTRKLDDHQSLGFKFNSGRNTFDSSGQTPLDLVRTGKLDRFGFMDRSDGGHVRTATAGAYYRKNMGSGDTVRADAFFSRSLFDLFSNFTFFLNDPVNGDEMLQHDSRLQQGGSAQFIHAGRMGNIPTLLTVGGNITDSRINVDLFHAKQRRIIAPVPGIPSTQSNVHLLNPAVYVQEAFDLPHVHVDAGLRFDLFRFHLVDRIASTSNQDWSQSAAPKFNLIYTPAARIPMALHFNFGRAVTSQDARGMAIDPNAPRVAATSFYMLGTSHHLSRFSASTDVFLIDRQHENVCNADNGTMLYQGPSRSYGWEAKTSAQLEARLTLNAGLTQVSNAFFRGTSPRQYVDSAPHTVASGSLTINNWHGLYSSMRYRHVSHYLVVNPDDTSVSPAAPDASAAQTIASGLDVVDFAATKKLRRSFEWNLSIDNLNNKRYYETQNFFDSRITPSAPVEARIHGTPGYPVGFTTGLTWRFE